LARLSYVFRKKDDIAGEPRSSEDCEFIVYGGGQESRAIASRVRRRIAMDMLDALRDAEAQLASWRNSPLRPLLEDAFASLSRADLDRVASALESATDTMEAFLLLRILRNLCVVASLILPVLLTILMRVFVSHRMTHSD
jgi:putative ATP-dependent endonuclease of OLD family